MYERFTEKSIKVFLLAENEARKLGHVEIGTEHILLGMLKEKTGHAAQALKAEYVELKNVHTEVQRLNHPQEGRAPEIIPLSEAARSMLVATLKHVQSVGVDYIATEFLLLGMLDDDNDTNDNLGYRILLRLDVNPSMLQEKVMRIAVGESILLRMPPDKRLRNRQPVTEDQIIEALEVSLLSYKNRNKEDKEASDDRTLQSLAEVVKSILNAKESAESEERFELAAWFGSQHQILIKKIEDEGGDIIDLGMRLHKMQSEEDLEKTRLYENLSQKTINLIRAAMDESYRLGHNYVGPEQILIALIGENPGMEMVISIKIGDEEFSPTNLMGKDSGIATRTFKKLGVTVDDARENLEKIIGRGPGLVAEEPPLNEAAIALFDRAKKIAEELQDDKNWSWLVETEHILLALIENMESTDGTEDNATKLFKSLEVDIDELKAETLRLEPDSRLLTGLVSPQIMIGAEEEAKRTKHDKIQAEHILLGLVKEGLGIASRVMKMLGVTVEGAQEVLDELVGHGDHSGEAELTFGSSAEHLIKLARKEAKKVGHGYLGSEHILLAIINNEDDAELSAASKILRKLEINFDKLREEVESRLINCLTGEVGDNFMK